MGLIYLLLFLSFACLLPSSQCVTHIGLHAKKKKTSFPCFVCSYSHLTINTVGQHDTEVWWKCLTQKCFNHPAQTHTHTRTHEHPNFGQWTLSARMSDTLDRLQPFNELVITAIINQSIHQPLSNLGRAATE